MYLMYVDESGDCGMPADGSPSGYFCLSGLVVHELRWRDTMTQLLSFRHWLKGRYKVYLDDELHAADMITKPSKVAPSLQRLSKHERLAIIRHFADEIATLADVSIINVVVDKRTGRVPNKDEVFRWAWYSLFQRFENTIRYQNFPGPKNADDRGIVFPDATDGKKLKVFLETMRLSNQLKVRQSSGAFVYQNVPIRVIIEDPVVRDSQHSYLIQAADCAVFLLKQSTQPSSYVKKTRCKFVFQATRPSALQARVEVGCTRSGAPVTAQKWGLLAEALGDPTARTTRGSDPVGLYCIIRGKQTQSPRGVLQF